MKIPVTELAVLLWAVIAGDTAEEPNPWERDFLLPGDVTPSHYELYLFPDLDTGNFSGSVTIDINVSQQKDHIWLHAVDLTLTDTVLTTKQQTGGASVAIDDTFLYDEYSFLVIKLRNSIPKGQYRLKFTFIGTLRLDNAGLFIYSHEDSKNERKLVGSFFEPYAARSAFPCFDQPGMKSTFTLRAVRPSQYYRALSNMDQVSEATDSPSGGLTTVLFNTTPPMSTYLVALFITDYDKLQVRNTDSGIPVTMYGYDTKRKQLAYAFNLAVAALNFYSKYFDVAYTLPKLDLVAFPQRSYAGFEGWGLSWLNEGDAMYERGITSTYRQYNLVELVEHEIAHMWCGDSVTPTWWSDLFVSEGLAYYLQFVGIDNQYPSWEIFKYLAYYTYSQAMAVDVSETAPPIVPHVKSIDDGDNEDNEIMYNKSPSILNMLVNTIGSENFRRGISSFVKTYTLKNARPADVWKHVQSFSSGVNITKFMASFTEKNGFPLVNVIQVGNTLTLTQSRFRTASNVTYTCNDSSEDVGCVWEIPITVVGSNNYTSTSLYWLHMDKPTLEITLPPALTWYKLNRQQIGYYVVQYSQHHWNTLAQVLKYNPKEMDAADRANLIYEAFLFAKNGHLQLETAFNMTVYMDKEDYYIAWKFFSDIMAIYDNLFAHSSVQPFFRRFLLNKVAPHMDSSVFMFDPDSSLFQSLQVLGVNTSTGFPGRNVTGKNLSMDEVHKEEFNYYSSFKEIMENYQERWHSHIEGMEGKRKNRLLADLACRIGERYCLKSSKRLFVNWLLNCGAEISADVRDIVFATGVAKCGVYEWDALWSRYLNQDEGSEKDFLFMSLCYSTEPWIIERLIELSKDENLISADRYRLLLETSADNQVALPIMWDYFRTNPQYVIKRAELTESTLTEVLQYFIATFNTELRLKQLEDLFEKIPSENLGTAARTPLLDSINYSINFLKENENSLRKWFQDATQETVI